VASNKTGSASYQNFHSMIIPMPQFNHSRRHPKTYARRRTPEEFIRVTLPIDYDYRVHVVEVCELCGFSGNNHLNCHFSRVKSAQLGNCPHIRHEFSEWRFTHQIRQIVLNFARLPKT